MVFSLEGLLGDLDPKTMRRIASQLRRQQVTLLERADWLDERKKQARELKRQRITRPLTPAQKKKIERTARDQSIVRDAWKGMTDIALAEKYRLSRKRIWEIRKAAAQKAALDDN